MDGQIPEKPTMAFIFQQLDSETKFLGDSAKLLQEMEARLASRDENEKLVHTLSEQLSELLKKQQTIVQHIAKYQQLAESNEKKITRMHQTLYGDDGGKDGLTYEFKKLDGSLSGACNLLREHTAQIKKQQDKTCAIQKLEYEISTLKIWNGAFMMLFASILIWLYSSSSR